MTFRLVFRRPLVRRAYALAVIAALGLAGMATAQAENLMDAYRQALQNDPVLKQAEAQSRIGAAGAAQSRAILLPQLNANMTFNDSHGTQSQTQLVQTPTGPAYVTAGGGNSGRSRSESVALNQILFDLGDFEQWRAAKATARATTAQYVSAQQNLILRVASAYFTVLTDKDQLKYAESNAASLKKQLDQSQAQYSVGLVAVTDVADAKASYDSALASVITAKNQLFNDRQALEQITGQPASGLQVLTSNLPLNTPEPNDMDSWVKTALASNPALRAQRDALESAQHDVAAAHASHLPSLGATVSYARQPSWSGAGNVRNLGSIGGPPSSFQQVLRSDSRSTNTAIGLTLTVPLFQGGGIIAREKQAIAQRDQARDVLRQDHLTTVSNTRNAFNAISAGIAAVQADKAAVDSAKTALDATQAGHTVGATNITQVLIAQAQYIQALSAYSQARHALVINRLNLKFAAGTLSVKDLEHVNTLLR